MILFYDSYDSKLEESQCYISKRTNSPDLRLEDDPQVYVGSPAPCRRGPSSYIVCYKHCLGVQCGHCSPAAISRPAMSSTVCVDKAGGSPGWLGPPHHQNELCSEKQLQQIRVLLQPSLLCWTPS